MRIGVVSDTHNNLNSVCAIVEIFNRANVDLVVHTGDITQPKTLAAFGQLASPLVGVFGNNDQGEKLLLLAKAVELGFALFDPPFSTCWNDRRVTIVHDPIELEGLTLSPSEVVLHGHTHRQRIERSSNGIIFNPGECAGHMVGYNQIGVLDLVTLDTTIERF